MKLKFIEAGEIVTTHGVRGEVKLLPWLDTADALKAYTRCRIADREYKILGCRVQKNCCLLKLEGIDNMEAAEKLRGSVVSVYREDVPAGMIFAAEMIGIQVWADGSCIGQVAEVLDYPGNMVYVIRGEHEYTVPAVKEFILNIDNESERMEVRLLEGMRDDED